MTALLLLLLLYITIVIINIIAAWKHRMVDHKIRKNEVI